MLPTVDEEKLKREAEARAAAAAKKAAEEKARKEAEAKAAKEAAEEKARKEAEAARIREEQEAAEKAAQEQAEKVAAEAAAQKAEQDKKAQEEAQAAAAAQQTATEEAKKVQAATVGHQRAQEFEDAKTKLDGFKKKKEEELMQFAPDMSMTELENEFSAFEDEMFSSFDIDDEAISASEVEKDIEDCESKIMDCIMHSTPPKTARACSNEVKETCKKPTK